MTTHGASPSPGAGVPLDRACRRRSAALAARRNREAGGAPRTGARRKRSRCAPGADGQGYRRVHSGRLRRSRRQESDPSRHQGTRSAGARGQPAAAAHRGLRRARDRGEAGDVACRPPATGGQGRAQRLAHRARRTGLERLGTLSPRVERHPSVRRPQPRPERHGHDYRHGCGHGVCRRDSRRPDGDRPARTRPAAVRAARPGRAHADPALHRRRRSAIGVRRGVRAD